KLWRADGHNPYRSCLGLQLPGSADRNCLSRLNPTHVSQPNSVISGHLVPGPVIHLTRQAKTYPLGKNIGGAMTPQVEQRLAAIRGVAPRRSPNVRVLAGYAQHTNCNLATLGFAAGVNFDRLLVKTRFQMPFGQSPFAIGRGF